MVYNIHIQSNRTKFYEVTVTNPLSNKVDLDEPYDKLSKKFNRYTHIIQYQQQPYHAKDYNLCLDNPNEWFYKKFFYLYKPKIRILSVDIFFQSNDRSKTYPLIFGFNEEGGNSYYYTYYFLRGKGSSTGTITNGRWIEKDDLLTRLLEEYGLHETTRYNKFVIKLDKKPTGTSSIKYPKSGHNTERITVTKKDVAKFSNYVKYEHVINDLNNVESFYISFHRDSLFIIGNSGFGKLKSVHVYYNKYNADKPIIFVFKSHRQIKLYKYSQFFKDVNKNNPTKEIYGFDFFSESDDLEKALKVGHQEVNKEITFKKDNHKNQNILLTDHKFTKSNIDLFKRSMLTPKIDFAKTESLKGPWEVYKSSLFSEASKPTIENNLFDDLHNSKFTAIYVYYTNDLEPLLVVFISDSGNKFFRLKKGGKSWENINNFNIIDYDGDLIEKLRQIETEKKPPDTEALPKPGPVKRQEGSDTSQYQRALGGDQPSLTTATASILPGRQSSQRPESTQSRSFGSTAVTSQTTDSTTQRSKVALSPPQPARTTFLHTPQKGQDTGVPSTQLSTSFKLSVTTGREPSHTERTDRRGEMGTGLQNTHNLNEISLEGKGDQGIYTQIQSTPNDQNFSYSSSHLNPHSEPQLSDDKKDDDNNDESISKTAKIAGGVAGTAIGAGAIGVGAHYAHGVASLTHWLV